MHPDRTPRIYLPALPRTTETSPIPPPTYSGAALGKVVGSCLAWAARALASRLITVRLVGVMEVRGPPASSGRLRPGAPVAASAAAPGAPFVGDSWLPLLVVAFGSASVATVVPGTKDNILGLMSNTYKYDVSFKL